MILSYSKKFIYLRTIKVASSSLEFYFSQFCDTEDIITVDYSKLVPVLLKEIQDLRKRVATLENN